MALKFAPSDEMSSTFAAPILKYWDLIVRDVPSDSVLKGSTLIIFYYQTTMWYSKGEEEVAHTCLEVVGGDCRCNRTPPHLELREVVYLSPSFFLSIFSLNNSSNPSNGNVW